MYKFENAEIKKAETDEKQFPLFIKIKKSAN